MISKKDGQETPPLPGSVPEKQVKYWLCEIPYGSHVNILDQGWFIPDAKGCTS